MDVEAFGSLEVNGEENQKAMVDYPYITSVNSDSCLQPIFSTIDK